jgi:phage pi2 protein 07
VQTSEPHWLDEAYLNPINISDTGILMRNIELSEVTAALLFFIYGPENKYLDYAGGYGILTRLMRDLGFDFSWHDPFTTNLLARGFEYNPGDKIQLLTTFESFEHFVEPLTDIEKMLEISKNILFTTTLVPSPVPQPETWWYYGLEHGQHISFYSRETLQFIAKQFNLHFYSNQHVHLITEKEISPYIFNSIIKHRKFLLNRYIKPRLTSKTIMDMEFVSKLPR